jgi:hypothetical protein
MTVEDMLWEMEERFWLDGADAARTRIADNAVMIFPYPAGILQGEAGVAGMAAAPRWRTVRMDDRVCSRKGSVAVLAYRVSAERAEDPIYRALCASTYLDDGGDWRLVSHQQTPVGEEDLPKAPAL